MSDTATYEIVVPVQSDGSIPTESEITRALEVAGILGSDVERQEDA